MRILALKRLIPAPISARARSEPLCSVLPFAWIIPTSLFCHLPVSALPATISFSLRKEYRPITSVIIWPNQLGFS